MNKHFAVILSGCGVFDGAEINETVLTLLALEQNDCTYQAFAPNIRQHHVVDHLTGNEQADRRNVLTESARIVRGDIKALADIKVNDFDGLLLPGGFGAAKNLCDFAFKGSEFTVQHDVATAVNQMKEANKPVGFICIAPVMIAKLYPQGTKLTIGTDKETAAVLEQLGATHVNCQVNEIAVDETHKVVSTPAYMLAETILQAKSGIDKLVAKVIALA